MRAITMVFGVLLAGALWAQGTATTPPLLTFPPSNTIGGPVNNTAMLTNLPVQPAAVPGQGVVRLIQVNYIDIQALCQALGGYCIDLRPLMGFGGDVRSTGNPNGLDPNAPLAPLVPQGVHNIIGVVR